MKLNDNKLWVVVTFNGEYSSTHDDFLFDDEGEAEQHRQDVVVPTLMEDQEISNMEAQEMTSVDTLHNVIESMLDVID